ncbi:DNA-binding response regulator, OmpR family, contains REC and winged-helix (wHTH) domain [Nocardioides terrae]|uniref:DNA-binding response regulator, OmpR family, contains REC and winged-helix (WHTH) domain n=1 Tax=Nocardioides terrae TaxID=574651 RepID=A0A1I1JJV2_9ACTN|nr:response regulator transcription factor [Nocardioides terrae]SFC48834.1 DNA-binding response regulator, OmpR family, contains REC and winged-helix (wHTH) domain [Nocardioides terrae]
MTSPLGDFRAHAGVATHVLVLEDDYGLRTSLRLVLEQDGYSVLEASDAETALTLLSEHAVDVMLVDLMLGGIDGFTFIRNARPQTAAPILIISARDSAQDVVAALEAGADDYVRKPFEVEEVKARLNAALRRPSIIDRTSESTMASHGMVLDSRHGPLVFDPLAATLKRGGADLHLTHTEFKLLLTLTENAGHVMSRAGLLNRVWSDGHFGDERIVDVHIRRLRTKIEPDPGSPELVLTIRGLGYRLEVR